MTDTLSVDVDLLSMIDMDGIARAAESEDDLACVLRCHLVLERTLHFYLDQKRLGDMVLYVLDPWQFAQALSLAVAFGLPLQLAAGYKQINAIRNKMAHGKLTTLRADEIQALATSVNRLSEISSGFVPVQRRFIGVHKLHQEAKVDFGQGETRMDFMICALALLQQATDWISRDTVRRKLGEDAPTWL